MCFKVTTSGWNCQPQHTATRCIAWRHICDKPRLPSYHTEAELSTAIGDECTNGSTPVIYTTHVYYMHTCTDVYIYTCACLYVYIYSCYWWRMYQRLHSCCTYHIYILYTYIYRWICIYLDVYFHACICIDSSGDDCTNGSTSVTHFINIWYIHVLTDIYVNYLYMLTDIYIYIELWLATDVSTAPLLLYIYYMYGIYICIHMCTYIYVYIHTYIYLERWLVMNPTSALLWYI